MKSCIVYASTHHGNTKKVVDAIAINKAINVPFSVYNTCFGNAYVMDGKEVDDKEKTYVDGEGNEITEENLPDLYPVEDDD